MKKIKIFTLFFLVLCGGNAAMAQSITDELPGDPGLTPSEIFEINASPKQSADMLNLVSVKGKEKAIAKNKKSAAVTFQQNAQLKSEHPTVKADNVQFEKEITCHKNSIAMMPDKMLASK